MNMISTAFPIETSALNKKNEIVKRLTSVWEKKNAKAAKAGGVSLMALSLAACGAEDETPFAQSDIDTAVAAVDITTDNAAAVATAVAAVDITTDNAAAVATAVAAVDITTDNAAAVATAVAAVDLTTDNAAATSLVLRDAAAELGVTGTSTMTNAELITAIKVANDTAVANAVDTSTDDAAAISAAVLALGYAGVTTLAQLNTAYDALLNPVITSYTLTTGVDTMVGSTGDDTFNAGLSGTALTMNSLDSVDGGAGTDSLNISLNGSVTPGVVKNVETINVTVSATSTFNLTNATGYTTLSDVGSTAVGTYTNIESTAVALKVADNAVGASFGYKASVLTGSSDTVNLTLANATGSTVQTILVGAIETVNVTSSTSANNMRLDSDATTLNISGSADLTLNAASTVMDKTTVVDASAASGKVVVTHAATAGVGAVTITGGSGNDTLTITGTIAADDTVSGGGGDDTIAFSAALTDADTIDGGAGTDTLSGVTANLQALTVAANVSNMEGISVSNAHTGTTTTATIQAGIDTVTLAAGSNGGTVVMEAGAKTLALGTASAGASTTNDTGLAVADSLTITTLSTADSTNGQDMTINGFETVSLSTNTATAKTIDNITINGDPDGLGVNTAATLTLTGAASLTHAAGGAVTLGVAAATGSIDASAMTAAYVQTTASIGASTITGGTGADTLIGSAGNATTIVGNDGIDTLTGGTAADIMTGGAGNDIIHGSGGADVLTGGLGNDTFRMDDAQLLATATLSGGDGTDVLLIEDLSAVADAQMTLVTSVESLTSAATGLSATLGAEAMEAGITSVTLAGTNAVGVADTVTVAKEFTSDLTVNLDLLVLGGGGGDDTNTFDASASVSAVNFVASTATEITVAASVGDLALTGGTTANDKLTTVGGTFVAADLVDITGVETFIVSDDTTASFTLSDLNTTATQSLTVDGRAIINTANTFTVDGTAENDGVITVHGSAGADAITGTVTATLGDTLNGYGGADIITVAVDGMQIADTIDGGNGSDTLKISGTGTLVDADLTNVTNIEKFEHTGTSTLTTLGTEYMASGSVDITLAAAVNSLNLDAITNNQTLNLAAGTDTIDASAMTGTLSVVLTETSLTSGDTITGGTGSADSLTVTMTSATGITAAELANVSGIEKFIAKTNVAGGFASADAMTAAASSLELDFTALTSSAAIVNLALESNAGITLNTGGGVDAVTMSISSIGDTINTGAGNDGITTAIAQLTAADTVNGGTGTDTVTLSDAGALADADFTGVTNIEALTLAAGTNTIVLGAEYNESGSVTVTGGSGADSITMGAGVTTAQTIALATAGADTVVATNASGVITVTMDDADMTAADTLTGGSASDVLTITGTGNSVTGAEMANVTGFENVKVASNAAFDLSLADANTVSGIINVDAALATSAGVIFSAVLENDGTINYTGGGGIDTVTGADTTATGDIIGLGAGADVLNSSLGADTITTGAGADTLTYTAVADSTGTAKDSITDYASGSDEFTFTINNTTSTVAQTYDAVIQTAQAGTSAVQASMSGSIGQTFFDTTNNTLVVNANADNLVTTLDYQVDVNAAATAANTIAAGDVNFVITGGSGADIIVAGGGDDTLTGGGGIDTITGGAGKDDIDGGAQGDIIVYTEIAHGGAEVTITNVGTAADDFTVSTSLADTVAFVTTVDDIKIDGTLEGLLENAAARDESSNTANLNYNTIGIFVIETAQAQLNADDFGDISDLATNFAIGNGTVANATANDEILFTIENASASENGLYYFKDVDGDGDITAGDIISLIAVIEDAAIVAADIII